MIFRLFNGAKTKEAWNPNSPEFIDDWKPEELVIKCDAVSMTYGSHVRVHVHSVPVDDEDMIELFWDKDGFIEHNGVFYGDFIVDNDTN